VPDFHRRRPLECIRTIRIFLRHLLAVPNAVEEVNHKQYLHSEYYDSSNGDKLIHFIKVGKRIEYIEAVIAPWYTGHTQVVHRPENSVSTNQSSPEVNLTQRFIHETAVHFGEPVVNTRIHTEEGRYPHHNVEVSNNEVGIVQLYVDGRIAQEDTRKTPGNEHRHKSYTKQDGRIEANRTAIQGRLF